MDPKTYAKRQWLLIASVVGMVCIAGAGALFIQLKETRLRRAELVTEAARLASVREALETERLIRAREAERTAASSDQIPCLFKFTEPKTDECLALELKIKAIDEELEMLKTRREVLISSPSDRR